MWEYYNVYCTIEEKVLIYIYIEKKYLKTSCISILLSPYLLTFMMSKSWGTFSAINKHRSADSTKMLGRTVL